MLVYIYNDRFITNDQDKMDDFIFDKLSEQNHYPNDELCASEYAQCVEEEEMSAHDMFSLMDNGFVFLNHVSKV